MESDTSTRDTARAMAQENVEIVRQMFDAFNRGDLEATLDFLAPEYEFRPSGLFMDTKDVYRGHEGWSEFWHAFHASWESMTISVERIENLGEQALVLGTLHGKGMEAGSKSNGSRHGS